MTQKSKNTSGSNYGLGYLILLFCFVVIYFVFKTDTTFEGQTLQGGSIMYTSSDLNVRSKPSIKGKKIETLPINTKIIVSKEKINDWVFVGRLDSSSLGFVSKKYLQQNKYSKTELDEIKESRNNKSNSSTKITSNNSCVTKNVNMISCVSESYLDKSMNYITKNDLDAVQYLLNAGFCSYIIPNTPVYLESSSWSGKVEIRPKGSTSSIWTVKEAIDCK